MTSHSARTLPIDLWDQVSQALLLRKKRKAIRLVGHILTVCRKVRLDHGPISKSYAVAHEVEECFEDHYHVLLTARSNLLIRDMVRLTGYYKKAFKAQIKMLEEMAHQHGQEEFLLLN